MNNSPAMSLIDAYLSPKTVFEQLKVNKTWSFIALLIMCALASGTTLFFFKGMSPEWIVEQQLMAAGEMTLSERDSFQQALEKMAPNMGMMTAATSAIFIIISIAIYALYYKIIGHTLAPEQPNFTFGDWFSFSIWTQVPLIVYYVGFCILFSTASSSDLPLSLMTYASVNQLLLGLDIGHALYDWAEALSVFTLWMVAIAAVGLYSCCRMSMVKSVVCALLPNVLIYGIWFLFI